MSRSILLPAKHLDVVAVCGDQLIWIIGKMHAQDIDGDVLRARDVVGTDLKIQTQLGFAGATAVCDWPVWRDARIYGKSAAEITAAASAHAFFGGSTAHQAYG